MPIAFLFTAFSLAFSAGVIWLPFRAGRKSWALFDLMRTLMIVIGSLFGSSEAQGWVLWVSGLTGVLFGIAACLFDDALIARYRSHFQIHWRSSFACTLVFVLASSVSGGYLSRLLLS